MFSIINFLLLQVNIIHAYVISLFMHRSTLSMDIIIFMQRDTFCNSMPLGALRAYYGKVRTFLSAA